MRKSGIGEEYLTRADIAEILKVSPKQAGRLMEKMVRVMVGKRSWRVARADFDAWLDGKKMEDAARLNQIARQRSLAAQTLEHSRATPILSSASRVVRKHRPLPPLD